jgi:NADPH-dependent 2,4-dienoyl-CoA reductase/sulfur reductase-like enzyme
VRKIVVVGTSLAGVTAADQLRELGYDGTLELIGEEAIAPYDRPPLSKSVFEADLAEKTLLRQPAHFRSADIALHLGVKAIRLDVTARQLSLASGEDVAFDGLIIATGARPRRPGFPLPERGTCFLRTLDDALALRRALQARPRLVIIGAGFIGMEVATIARQAGLDVTVIEPAPFPMFRALGPEAGTRIRRMLEDCGCRTVFERSAIRIIGDKVVQGVELSDGSVTPADLVLLSIGSVPNSDWLEGSSLILENGIVCDEFCQAAPAIFAVGDVASRFEPSLGRRLRSEHWTNAIEDASVAAHNLLRPPAEWRRRSGLAYVWSDQFGGKLQIAGLKPEQCMEHVFEHADRRRFAACYHAGGRLRAIATFEWPGLLARGRALITQNSDWETARGILGDQAALRRQPA